jgi:hypothetical protein
MKLKGLHFADAAEIQEAITDELKTVQKEEFSAAFQKLYDLPKACIYANGAYFEFKKGMCLRFLTKSISKLLNRTVYSTNTRVGPKVLGLTYKSRAECKMLRGIYSAIYGEVNVSVLVCVEIKGDYIEK